MAKNLKPFFSIIIPTLNEEKYLPPLLSDLGKQSYRDFEVIVVDGKSDDKTISKAKGFIRSLPKLTILSSLRRHVCIQRNLGATKARADWLIFMDADNRLPPYFLEGIKYRISQYTPQIFTVWCTTNSSKPEDITITIAYNLLIEAAKAIEFEGAPGSMIGCLKTLHRQLNGFSPKINFAEDADYVRRASRLGARFIIFKDPKYFLSLRRFKREGTLRTAQISTKLYFKQIMNQPINQAKEYPMGGRTFSHKTPHLFTLNNSLKKITKNSKLLSSLKQTLQYLLK